MDRRQKKTRKAIFEAFITLLSTKHYNNVTVGEIIDLANVGRATFYAHFETKDFLLKDLCTELFDHLFHAESDIDENPSNLFHCETKASPFLHLFQHIQENDNNLAKLLSSKNNELFLEYFKSDGNTFKLFAKIIQGISLLKSSSKFFSLSSSFIERRYSYSALPISWIRLWSKCLK